MGKKATVYTVMIASPRDVTKERQIVRDELHRWNSMHSTQTNSILQDKSWDTDATPDLKDPAQTVINRQMVNQSDLIIGIFWTRLGSPTFKSESGTAEEIERVKNNGKRCIVYFSEIPVAPSQIDLEQYERLKAYKERLKKQGLIDEYHTLNEFQEKIARHITKAIYDIVDREKYPDEEKTKNRNIFTNGLQTVEEGDDNYLTMPAKSKGIQKVKKGNRNQLRQN